MSISLGVQGLFSILILLLSVLFTWMLLSVVKWEKIVHHPLSYKSIMLRIVLAVFIGNGLGSFVLKYMDYAFMLKYFVE